MEFIHGSAARVNTQPYPTTAVAAGEIAAENATEQWFLRDSESNLGRIIQMNSEYEVFCSKHGTFTQSALWADVKKGWENETVVSRDENGEINGTMLVLIKKMPLLGISALYAPRGPVCDWHDRKVLQNLFSQLREVAKQHRAFMVRIDPMVDIADVQSIENLKKLGFVYHPERVGYDTVQCRENYVLDIAGKTADEIFANFKSKWRYNIRLAQRKGVTCGFYGAEKLDDFMPLMEQTAERDGFCTRDKAYFENLLQSFGGKARLCMCYLGDEAISGALCIDYAGTMSYVYGCSSNQHRDYMPNYLMQWTMIQEAVANGDEIYDFCGVPYWYDETHKNYGVYRFKQGFGGRVQTYAGEFDYDFKPFLARLARTAATLKRKVRVRK